MTRSVFLSTFLFAAVLSPITLQPYTCGPPPEQARLAVLELRVESFAGENVVEGFNPNVFSYDVLFPESESVGVLWVKTNHPSTMVDVEYDGLPVQLRGQSVAEFDVPLGSSELAIHVTRQGVRPDAKTYIVHIRRVPVLACTEQGIREAIARGGGPIFFDCDGPTTVLTEAEIVIDNDAILDGGGNLIVDAGGGGGGTGGAGGGFAAAEVAPKVNGAHRVFSIPEGVTAELIGFTVTGGSTSGDGGGILNAGAFTLSDSAVTGNTANVGGGVRNLDTGTLMVTDSDVSQNRAARFGGGIHNWGQMDVVDSVVSNNQAGLGSAGISNWPEIAIMRLTRTTLSGNVTPGAGGGMSNLGTATLDETTISDNQAGSSGGGINNQGTLTMSQVTVSANSAPEDGGGVWNGETGTLTMMASTVSGNTAQGNGSGIFSVGDLVLVDSTVRDNVADLGDAGGIWSGSSGTLTLTGSTVSGNSAAGLGGGIRNTGAWGVLTNSTVSGNTGSQGGGIHSDAIPLTLTNSTVSGNQAGEDGGGILNENEGTLTLTGSTVTTNNAVRGGGVRNSETGILVITDSQISENVALTWGGGIHNGGQMEVFDSGISRNQAGNSAGGIDNWPAEATMTLTRTLVDGNTTATDGAAIVNSGFATLNEVTISDNHAGNRAGGVNNNSTGQLTMINGAILRNTAEDGGGVYNAGTVTLNQVTVSSNSAGASGGGVLNDEVGALTAVRCTVSGNSAGTWTGGIRNYGFAQIIDTTVHNNTAVNGGAAITNRPSGSTTITGVTVWGNTTPGRTGGIGNAGIMTVTNTTVSANKTGEARGAIGNLATGSMNLVSSTVSGNTALSGPSAIYNEGWMTLRNNIIDGDCEVLAPWNSLGGNVETPGNTCDLWHPEDQVFVTPEQLNLGPLQDNLGPTWTHALLPGSVAIDSADECVNAAGFPLFLDQRGAPRPYGPACDSGAFELGGVPLPGDLCTNDPDRAAYESLEYIDAGGNGSTCIDAATAIAADCVFGSPQSSPPLVGCPEEVAAVITCFPNCSPDVIAALDQCVADCTEGATGLSTACAGCYGEWAGCGAEVCVPECAGGGMQPQCIDCLFYAGCTGRFDTCSGLPGEVDCGIGVPQPTVACVNDPDRAVYESLTYIDDHGEFWTCIDAASAIGNDCVFGSSQSEPPLEGCRDAAIDVLGCFPNCPEEVIQIFGSCVASCTTGATGLSSTCGSCYGEAAACAAVFCTTSCVGSFESPSCVECRTQNGCIPGFDDCSGLPGNVDCSLVPNLCEGVDCDDQSQCTEDRCNYSDGTCSNDPVPNGWFCELGGGVPGLCTDGECIEDFCWNNPCDDGNQCTWDQCDSFAGTCRNDPRLDGSYCLLENGGGGGGGVSGVCVAGSCVEDQCLGNPCDDGDPCTSDACDPLDGSCSNDPAPDGWFCDAGGVPGFCVAGECVADELCEGLDCNDDNPCTFDECDPASGECIHDPYAGDGWPCDLFDIGDGICMEGECVEQFP